MNYIYDLPNWPHFDWDKKVVAQELASVRFRQGQLLGRMASMGFPLQKEAYFETLTQDVLKSSEIEGEKLDKEQVRSSLARRLQMDIGAIASPSRHVDGMVDMVLDATQNYSKPLTKARLFKWHRALFPTGVSGMRRIKVGAWRDDRKGPMQVVSGPIGHERVHFEAPDAGRINQEMKQFIEWFNNADTGIDPVLRAAIAHLWFVTIHPFEDGNGRIARALTDLFLARSENSSQRFYSMSAEMRIERNNYYGGLEATQKGTLDITDRLRWFLQCLNKALDGVENTLADVLKKSRFWEAHAGALFNERQRMIINKLLDKFEGKLTSTKWAKMTKCSQDTALRDILDLIDRGVLVKDQAGGRSTSYSLVTPLRTDINPARAGR